MDELGRRKRYLLGTSSEGLSASRDGIAAASPAGSDGDLRGPGG